MTRKLYAIENDVHSYPADGTLDDQIPAHARPITDAEADVLRAIAAQALLATTYDRDALRAAAYRAESDPLFFKSQRGEARQDDWLAKVDEIRARYP